MQPTRHVTTHDIVVIGASAGGVEAISTLVSGLPLDLRAAVLVVLHVSKGRSMLPEILTRAGRLPAIHPEDGDPLEHGRIYVARPDHHLVVEPEKVRVVHGPIENGCRPAVDPLLLSAARGELPRVIGIVLTGGLDDGTAGLAAVKEAGGIAIVQDPDEAFAPSMPRSARAFVAVDHVLPVREIGALVSKLTRAPTAPEPAKVAAHRAPLESDLAEPPLALHEEDRPGKVSVFTCPECHGTLWEADERGIVRFRCRPHLLHGEYARRANRFGRSRVMDGPSIGGRTFGADAQAGGRGATARAQRRRPGVRRARARGRWTCGRHP
jgi:two-component system chemotaxis response regulator CheB